MRAAMVVAVTLLSGEVAAAEPFPKLTVPDTTNPAVAAFVAWHAALLKGDFAAYRSFTPAVPDMSDQMLRQVFDQLRLTAPKTIKIAPPETIAPGAVRIQSAGCNGNQPVVSLVTAGKQNGVWIVAGSAWGPSWDPRISDHVKCP